MTSLLGRLLGKSPFRQVVEHTKKVHECVKLIRPLAEALLEEDYEKIDQLHHQMAQTEYEADQIKNEIRTIFFKYYFLAVDRELLFRYLSSQDDVADAAEDFAVLLRLRKTSIHPELKQDFMELVDNVIEVSERMLAAAEELSLLVETAFGGKEAEKVMETIKRICEMEWHADKKARRFAEHFYSIEDQLDPITIMMYDKYVRKLGQVANSAEKVGKHLRSMMSGS
jgi:predicted phosphate transport protein (TIGR00153 family)